MGRGDNHNLTNARLHQHTERIINHRLIIDRHELFGRRNRGRVQTRARTACENDSFA